MSELKNNSGNDIPALYTTLIKKGQPGYLLPFLQHYAGSNKTILRQEVKKAKKYWFDFVDLSKESVIGTLLGTPNWGPRGNKQQQDMVLLSAIVVFDKTEIMRWDEAFMLFNRLKEPHILEILEWARPTWLGTYLLAQLKKSEWTSLNYMNLRMLEDRRLVEYDPELFVQSMAKFPGWTLDLPQPEPQLIYIEHVINDPTAFQRDVPLLFEYETAIHGQLFTLAPGEKFNCASLWETIFSKLLAQGKMDRTTFIENCMLVQTKEWNGSLRSFFRKCLATTAPSTPEMLAVQHLLFACLHAQSNVVVSFAVDQLRKIWDEDQFNFESFIEFIEPVMMRSDCKGAIRHILAIFDKAVKRSPEYRAVASYLSAEVLVIPDFSLQERALKTLKKTGDPNDPLLTAKLSMYVPQMQGNIAEMLGPLLQGEMPEEQPLYEGYHPENRPYALLYDENRVPEFGNWNELLFHFGKFIQSAEIIDLERLLDAFITKRHLFPADSAEQLKSYTEQFNGLYFMAAYKHMASRLLIHLVHQKEGVFEPSNPQVQGCNVWNLGKALVMKIQEKITSGSTLSLLCFPTHLPYWIDPTVLIDRVIAYDKAREEIDPVDFVIAISRTRRENVAKAVAKIRQLPERYQRIFGFVLGTTDEIPVPEKKSIFSKLFGTDKSIDYVPWAVAARTFYPDRTFPEFEQTDLKDTVNVVAPYAPSVRIQPNVKLRRLVATLPKGKKGSDPRLLYSVDIYESNNRYWGARIFAEDVVHWHSVMPQNDQALASYLLRYCCEFTEGMIHENLRSFLHIASHRSFHFTETAYYVIAGSCFYNDAGLRSFAGEVLLFLIDKRRIDVRQFGEKLAWLLFEGYAPLQRFLDVASMIRDHSALHNGALRALLEAIVAGFEPGYKLPVGFKKLLEMYYDLLTKTKQEPGAAVLQNLTKIPPTGSLKPILKQLQSIS